jgi:hypothetical protein
MKILQQYLPSVIGVIVIVIYWLSMKKLHTKYKK